MSRLLTRLGVSVLCAENGAVALDMILGTDGAANTSGVENSPSSLRSLGLSPTDAASQHDHRFDVIYLDNQMVCSRPEMRTILMLIRCFSSQPVMSGLEVVRRLREMGRTDFVVGVTGNALLSDQEEYLEAGVNR